MNTRKQNIISRLKTNIERLQSTISTGFHNEGYVANCKQQIIAYKSRIEELKKGDLIAYATLNVAGKKELVLIYSTNSVFGTMTSSTVTIERATRIGTTVNVDTRYFNNITEFIPVN